MAKWTIEWVYLQFASFLGIRHHVPADDNQNRVVSHDSDCEESQAMTTTMTTGNASPALIPDLTDIVLVFAVRVLVGHSHDHRTKAHDLRTLHTLLTATGTGGHTSQLVRAAIRANWWLDVDWASERGHVALLDHMLAMRRTSSRPLQYTSRGIQRAAECGHFAVVRWWYALQAERVLWFVPVRPKPMGQGLLTVARQDPEQLQAQGEDSDIWATMRMWYLTLSDTSKEWAAKEILAQVIDSSRDDEASYKLLSTLSSFFAKLNPGGISVTEAMAQSVGKLKLEPLVGWLMAHWTGPSEGCHLHILIGALASGDLMWVQACFHRWQELARKPTVHGIQPPPPLPSWMHVQDCLQIASEAGHIELVEWTLNNLTHPDDNLTVYVDKVALLGQVHVLEWWMAAVAAPGFKPTVRLVSHTPNILCKLTSRGLTEVVQWWARASLLPYERGVEPVIAAARAGNLELLQWWDEQGQFLRGRRKPRGLPPMAVELASINGHVHVLEWWKTNDKGLRLYPFGETWLVEKLCRSGQMQALQWWYNNTLPAVSAVPSMWSDRATLRHLLGAAQGTQVEVFEWLSGLYSQAAGKAPPLFLATGARLHPTVVQQYVNAGFNLSVLPREQKEAILRTCIAKGYVLLLRELLPLVGPLTDSFLAEVLNSRDSSQFKRSWCVFDYLAMEAKHILCAKEQLVADLVRRNHWFVLEWMNHRGVTIEED